MAPHSEHPGIVVGVDGSPSSMTAVRWAAREAAMRNGELTLVYVSATAVATSSAVVWPEPVPPEVVSQHEANAAQLIEDAITQAHGVENNLRVDSNVFFAAPVPTLVDLSKVAQMIVVGRRGRGWLERVPLGSVSTGLLHHAHCPVAVIPAENPARKESLQGPVVVGIDGSPASERATAIAFDEASRRGVELVALHAWSEADVFGIQALEWAATEATADETLAERLAGYQEQYPDVAVRRVVVLDRPAHHLVQQSESAQLVVVGSHGRGGFAGMLLGSVGAAVAPGAHTPVIVARQR